MARLTGVEAQIARLRRLAGPGLTGEVGAALLKGGEAVKTAAQQALAEGGRHDDALAASITVTADGPLTVTVAATAPWAAAVEFGTSQAGERPFLRPAAARARGSVVAACRAAVGRAIGGGGGGNG